MIILDIRSVINYGDGISWIRRVFWQAELDRLLPPQSKETTLLQAPLISEAHDGLSAG